MPKAHHLIESLSDEAHQHACAVAGRLDQALGVKYDPVTRTFTDRAKAEYLDKDGVWKLRKQPQP